MADEKDDTVTVGEDIPEDADGSTEEGAEDAASEETSEETSTEDAPSEEKKGETVPIKRFNEIYRKGKELEEENEKLKKVPEGTLTEEQQKEGKAKDYIKGLVREAQKEVKDETTQIEAKEQREFASDVDDVLEENPDVKRTEFLKFIEDKSGIYDLNSPKGAMKVFLDLQTTSKDSADKTKKDMKRKPNLPSSEAAPSEPGSPDDKGKSFSQIAQEAVHEAQKKS